jgi:hypothetical protein
MDLVGDPEIVTLRGEADAERGAVVGLDALHCYGEAVPELLNEVDRGLHRLATVELKNPHNFLTLFGYHDRFLFRLTPYLAWPSLT